MWRGQLIEGLFPRQARQVHRLDDAPVNECIALIFGRVGAEADEDVVAVVVEMSRDGHAVAAVVAAAAEDEDVLI